MISLTINKQRIDILPLDDGSEVWDLPPIQRAHRDNEGSWVGIRKSLLDIALKRNVKFLNIRVQDVGIEFEISPDDFIRKAKTIEMPSKYYLKGYQLYLYPISDLVVKRSVALNKNKKLC